MLGGKKPCWEAEACSGSEFAEVWDAEGDEGAVPFSGTSRSSSPKASVTPPGHLQVLMRLTLDLDPCKQELVHNDPHSHVCLSARLWFCLVQPHNAAQATRAAQPLLRTWADASPAHA